MIEPENTFEGCRNLKKVILPDHLARIGKEAFKNCESVEELMKNILSVYRILLYFGYEISKLGLYCFIH